MLVPKSFDFENMIRIFRYCTTFAIGMGMVEAKIDDDLFVFYCVKN